MIEIEIINSPDKSMLGVHKVFFDSLILGTSKRAGLIIDDPKLVGKHLKLIVTENGVLCSNTPKAKFFHSNKKKVSGDKLHRQGDNISIGDTEFKILNFDQTDPSQINIRELYEKALKDNPELETILYYLEKELLYLEKAKHAD